MRKEKRKSQNEKLFRNNPLVKKLGMKDGDKILLLNTPENYAVLIDQCPDSIEILDYEEADNMNFIHFFTMEKGKLAATFPALKKKLKKDGII